MQSETRSIPLATIPPILKPDECRQLAKVGKSTIFAAIKSGDLPSFKKGRGRFIAGADFADWLQRGMAA